MQVLYNRWYCCQLDVSGRFELCKIKRYKTDINKFEYYVITYYDCKEVFKGSLFECDNWIKTHFVERKYINNAEN